MKKLFKTYNPTVNSHWVSYCSFLTSLSHLKYVSKFCHFCIGGSYFLLLLYIVYFLYYMYYFIPGVWFNLIIAKYTHLTYFLIVLYGFLVVKKLVFVCAPCPVRESPTRGIHEQQNTFFLMGCKINTVEAYVSGHLP